MTAERLVGIGLILLVLALLWATRHRRGKRKDDGTDPAETWLHADTTRSRPADDAPMRGDEADGDGGDGGD